MRIVGWQVQPIVMADDGETLESRNVQGQFIPVKQWDDFKNGGDELALKDLRGQIEADDGAS